MLICASIIFHSALHTKSTHMSSVVSSPVDRTKNVEGTMHTRKKQENRTGEIEKKLGIILERKTKALTSTDPKRIFFESFYGFRLISRNTIGNYEASAILGTSTIFFFSGVFFKLGKKFMEFGLKNMDEQYVLGWVWSKFVQYMYVYYAGRKTIIDKEEKIYKLGIKLGEYWPLSIFYVYGGFNAIEWGNEKLVLHYLKRLRTVGEVFDNDFPEVQYYRVKTLLYIKFRKMAEVLKVTDEAISITVKTDHKMQLLFIYCFRSIAFSILEDSVEARNNLSEAEKLMGGTQVPIYVVTYLLAISYFEITEFKGQSNIIKNKKKILITSKKLVKSTSKIKSNRTEAYRLQAIVYCLLNKSSKALKNFDRSIKAGKNYSSKLELSRTYFEVGKFLRDPKNKKDRINGMNGTECLLKAKSMFEEMGLEWDLREYEKYMEV